MPANSGILFASALLTWLVYSLAVPSSLRLEALGLLVAVAAVIAWWYRVLPAAWWSDLLFMAFLAAGLLTKLFPYLFPPLSAQFPSGSAAARLLKTDFLGHLLWLRMAYWALLAIRNQGSAGRTTGFGFLPSRSEWTTGFRYFLYCLPAAGAALALIQPMKLKDNLSFASTPLVAAGTFLGILWVVALSEELFFRGILQPMLVKLTGGPWRGLLVASLVFGSVHLSYGRFPNWRMVCLAAILGLFCGRAAQVSEGIRAGMVTHALIVTVYRVFLTQSRS